MFLLSLLNPHAASNSQPISTCYRKHENTKKASLWTACSGDWTWILHQKRCYHLASMITTKHNQSYSSTMIVLVEMHPSFSLLRSAGRAAKQQLPPVDLVASEACFVTWATLVHVTGYCTHPDTSVILLPLQQLTSTMSVFRSLSWYFPPYFIHCKTVIVVLVIGA